MTVSKIFVYTRKGKQENKLNIFLTTKSQLVKNFETQGFDYR